MEGTKMSISKIWRSISLQLKIRVLNNLSDQLDHTFIKIKGLASRILSPVRVEMNCMKDEVWVDLSRIYYKYEDIVQKQAFREVLLELSEKINEGNWESVYKKLYRIEQSGI